MRYRYRACVLMLASFITFTTNADTILTVEVKDEEISVERYPAPGDELVLYISAGMGRAERLNAIAAGVAGLGIEFWNIDIAENLFLPKSTSTFRSLDGSIVAGLIQQAHDLTGKNVTVMAHAYAALPALRGIRKWQQAQAMYSSDKTQAYLNGIILLSPDLYIEVPALGLDPIFSPISTASNIPVMIFQSGSRSNRWQLDRVVQALQKGGAVVFSKIFPGVTGVFYGEDRAPETLSLINNLPAEIQQATKLLRRIPTSTAVAPLPDIRPKSTAMLDMTLTPFTGAPMPPALDLYSVKGDRVIHKNFTGKVTLVNFWASWCRPCIEEIPSLNRLRMKMKGKAFELISVDYAEDKAVIQTFLKEVNVDFPVLLDSTGEVSSQWNVIVFPSTFVIGPDGRIVYGVKGGIEWDSPEVIRKILLLLE